jgi:hypothetical protein
MMDICSVAQDSRSFEAYGHYMDHDDYMRHNAREAGPEGDSSTTLRYTFLKLAAFAVPGQNKQVVGLR